MGGSLAEVCGTMIVSNRGQERVWQGYRAKRIGALINLTGVGMEAVLRRLPQAIRPIEDYAINVQDITDWLNRVERDSDHLEDLALDWMFIVGLVDHPSAESTWKRIPGYAPGGDRVRVGSAG